MGTIIAALFSNSIAFTTGIVAFHTFFSVIKIMLRAGEVLTVRQMLKPSNAIFAFSRIFRVRVGVGFLAYAFSLEENTFDTAASFFSVQLEALFDLASEIFIIVA